MHYNLAAFLTVLVVSSLYATAAIFSPSNACGNRLSISMDTSPRAYEVSCSGVALMLDILLAAVTAVWFVVAFLYLRRRAFGLSLSLALFALLWHLSGTETVAVFFEQHVGLVPMFYLVRMAELGIAVTVLWATILQTGNVDSTEPARNKDSEPETSIPPMAIAKNHNADAVGRTSPPTSR